MRSVMLGIATVLIVIGVSAVLLPAFIANVPYHIAGKSTLAVIGLAVLFVGIGLAAIFDVPPVPIQKE